MTTHRPAAHPFPAPEGQTREPEGVEPERGKTGDGPRHAADPSPPDEARPADTATEPASDAGDPDDPENLAEWVDSLTEEESVPGLPRRVPRHAAPPSEDAEESSPAAVSRAELIQRLDALATLVRIGSDSVEPDLMRRSQKLLDHAGNRLRLSTDHTVVALAGGTGSGKSSLFNALSGLDLSEVGITRPVTSMPHACVWGKSGTAALLDWLEVPHHFRHTRASELDPGEGDLVGLVLLDLPDHDSVRTAHSAHAERILGAVDLMVWVLDPQKYADAAVHHRYLADLGGHGAVMVAVVNQVDKLSDREAEDCVFDLERLLERQGNSSPQILLTSTVTGQGVSELRDLLAATVGDRRASTDRLVADLDQVVGEFGRYAEPGEHDRPSWETLGGGVPDHVQETLSGYVATASGVTAVAAAVETDYEQRGTHNVAWPIGRIVGRLRRDPLRGIRSDFEQIRGGVEGSVGVQWAEVESAIDEAADSAAEGLPDGWPARVRDAAKSRATDLPEMLGSAVAAAATPPSRRSPTWWGWIRGLQYVFLALAVMALAWIAGAVVAALGGVELIAGMSDLRVTAFVVVVLVSVLLLGLFLNLGSRNLISVTASRLRESVEEHGRRQVRDVVQQHVLGPLHQELVEYQRFTVALSAARGNPQA